MDKISVIIPCRNEEKYIASCLDSIVNNDYPKEKIEIFVVDGGSFDNTVKIAEDYIRKFDFIKLLRNKKKTVPYAMNLGISEAKGDYIVRIDAHAIYPNNYLSKLVYWNKKLNADNVGALWITDVKKRNSKTNSIKKVLSNKFGVGNSHFRTGINEIKEVDTVPFGCFKREVFEKFGLYDIRLDRDQDIELNKRIRRGGGKIFLVPDISSTYYARETYSGIAKNNFQTGYWNLLTVYLTKRLDSLSFRHFIPLLFLLSIVLPIIMSVIYPRLLFISLLSLFTYLILLIAVSWKLKDKSTSFFYLIWSFIVLHISYGFGSLLGLFRIDKIFERVKTKI